MNRSDVEKRVKIVLKKTMVVATEKQIDEICDSTSLIEDLALDSIQILELVVNLENEFNIVCEAEELNIDIFDKFGDLITFILRKVE